MTLSDCQRGSLSPSLKLPTGQFFNARSGSGPDGTTKKSECVSESGQLIIFVLRTHSHTHTLLPGSCQFFKIIGSELNKNRWKLTPF